MAVITNTVFSSIADEIGQARILQLSVDDHIYNAVVDIVNLQEAYLDVEVDLLSEFWQSYQISLAEALVPAYMLSDISVLHQHVMDRAVDGAGDKYTDLNDWLRDESVHVYETYADMSEEAGWPIDHDRIKADPTVTITG